MRSSSLWQKIRRKIHPNGDSLPETDLRPYRACLEEIRALDLHTSSADDLRRRTERLAGEARRGAALDELLPEMFALVAEASRRAVGLDPHDCQILAGLAMARGRVAELPTGEGKTLAAVFPACLWSLAGGGVHVLTFNDYLARRDAAWMGPIYRCLGLRPGCIQEGQSPADKRAAYACEVTYATAKEAGFDFLRDQLAYTRADLVHRPFQAALVDEADSILIDEARIPLVIAGLSGRSDLESGSLAPLVKGLAAGRDYETDAEHRNVFLTEAGLERLEAALGCGSLFEEKNQRLLESVYCSLQAQALLRRDIDYIVRQGRIEIVDEFTGRVMDKRHWPDGLQAAVEAKEGLARRPEGRVFGSITLQHYFRLYPRLAGMTATAQPAAAELHEFYGLGVTVIPPHHPCLRRDEPDAVFIRRQAKQGALVEEIRRVQAEGRPVLVGTLSVKESEDLEQDLRAAGMACRVLNAKNDELEAGIIAQAGRPGTVTISTNMAGRGTDIKLGGPEEKERDRAVALGGLYVIGTNRHESLRIDHQLRGRAGRQGDPGSTRFFISLDDELFKRYGLTDLFLKRYRPQDGEETAEAGAVRRETDYWQRIIEGQNFDIRRTLYTYSSLVELQRKIVQEERQQILREGEQPDERILPWPGPAAGGEARLGQTTLARLERAVRLRALDQGWADHLAWVNDTRESIHLVSLGGLMPDREFQKSATAAFLEMMAKAEESAEAELKRLRETDDPALELKKIKGPSSTWTYLVKEDQFGWGVEMIKGKNIGLAVSAALSMFSHGPIYILVLALRRLLRKRKSP
ncbi:MAG: accessory Sec system translocase SecA2 [Candidatus Aminicenantales bacterium]